MSSPKAKGTTPRKPKGEILPPAKAKAIKSVKPRREIDWEAIEVAYRAGARSVLAIAKDYGCSHTAINAKAKAGGWTRDETEKLKVAVRAKLSSPSKVSTDSFNESFTETQTSVGKAKALDHEAELRAAVIKEHRELAAKAMAQANVMLSELEHANHNQDEDEAAIREECKDDKNNLRRERMLQSVKLPARSGVLVNISNAVTKIAALGREAWGLADAPPPNPNADQGVPEGANAQEAADIYAALIRGN